MKKVKIYKDYYERKVLGVNDGCLEVVEIELYSLNELTGEEEYPLLKMYQEEDDDIIGFTKIEEGDTLEQFIQVYREELVENEII